MSPSGAGLYNMIFLNSSKLHLPSSSFARFELGEGAPRRRYVEVAVAAVGGEGGGAADALLREEEEGARPAVCRRGVTERDILGNDEKCQSINLLRWATTRSDREGEGTCVWPHRNRAGPRCVSITAQVMCIFIS